MSKMENIGTLANAGVQAGQAVAEKAKGAVLKGLLSIINFPVWKHNKTNQIKFIAEQDTKDIAERHDIPRHSKEAPVPKDLRDAKSWFFKGKDGFRVTGRALPEDFTFGSTSPAEPLLVYMGLPLTYLALAFPLIGMPFLFIYLCIVKQALEMGTGLFAVLMLSMIGSVPMLREAIPFAQIPFVGGAIATLLGSSPKIFAWILTLLYLKKGDDRAIRLAKQGAKYNAESAMQLDELHIEARKAQAENARKDTSKFLPIGVSRGIFSRLHRDPFAPCSEDMPFGMSAGNDISTHLWVFGETGTGKTSSVLKPIGVNFALGTTSGMLVMDGKGQMPNEFAEIPDFILIDPNDKNTPLALIEGLPAEDVIDALFSVAASGQKEDYWKQEARRMALYATVLLEKGSEVDPVNAKYTPSNIMNVISDPDWRTFLLKVLRKHPEVDAGTVLTDAFHYWIDEIVHVPDQTRQCIVGTAMSVISQLIGHRDLQHWCKLDQGVDPTDCLRGKRIGISVPPFKYGMAGVIIQNLVKARVYREIRRRPANWSTSESYKDHTDMLLLIDEAQELCGQAELEVLAVARSLGLKTAFACQNIDQLYAKFGHDAAEAFLNNFRSLISFKSSPKTIDYIAERLGYLEMVKRKSSVYGINYAQEIRALSESPFNDPRHPNAKSLSKKVQNGLLGTIKNAIDNVGDADHEMGMEMEVVHESVFPPSLASVVLQEPFVCVAAVMRGGVVRRDVVKTSGVFDLKAYIEEMKGAA